MTEHTDTPTPADAKSFALDDWLVGGTEHRLTRSVVIYRDQHLQASIDDVRRRMRLASAVATNTEGNPEEAIGETSASTLEKEEAALLEQIQAAKAEVTVFALIDAELDEVKATGHDANTAGWWYQVLSRAARVEGHQLTPEQWAKLHQTIGAQLASVINAYTQAAQYERVVDAPFSPSASRTVTGR